mgnify:CR=1 FL=1
MSYRTDAVDIENRDFNLINIEFSEDELQRYVEDNADIMTRTRWEDIAQYQNLTENFMKTYLQYLPINRLVTYQPMSEDMQDFLFNYIGNLEDTNDPRKTMITRMVLQHQDVTERLMNKYRYMIHWPAASMYCNMSEDFIREFKKFVDWSSISKYKTLSEEFMYEMMDYLDYKNAFYYQVTTPELDEIFKNKINTYDDYFQAYWVKKNYIRNQEPEYWRNLIKTYKTYPTNYSDDYFIGYKAVRSDGYSLFSFRNKYIKENTYNTKSDFDNVEVSFGFGIYNRDKAYQYGMQKDNKRFEIIAVKVPYDAVTFCSENYIFPKVRTSEIEILAEDPEYYRYDD